MPRLPSSFVTPIPILLFLPLLGWTASIPLQNITIIVPPGTSQHGDDRLLCVPTRDLDIAIFFFLANYLAHAVTVRRYPGDSFFDLVWGAVAAFLLPTSGMFRGLAAISRGGFLGASIFGGSSLEVAARSGVLCMVVRTEDWKPLPGTEISHVAVTLRASLDMMTFPGEYCHRHARSRRVLFWLRFHRRLHALLCRDRSGITPSSFKISGNKTLPAGYALAFVPHGAEVVALEENDPYIIPPPSFDVLKGLITLGQAVYAFYTFYATRGDQLSRYGDAAFGLTVLPYAVMSMVNLLGALGTPEFDKVYLVQSDTLMEARSDQALDSRGWSADCCL
ncbi:hypothetical protein DFH09DRAFT_931698 [Mycena vulgaris]|nr:hypothetical protein DFH09DRAFT_931698 [Mycena vulgaris]